MTCCAPGLGPAWRSATSAEELVLASRALGEGLWQTDLSVPQVHCVTCIRAIEGGLARLPGVEYVRVNLSTKRVSVKWRDGAAAPPMLERLAELGYQAHPFQFESDEADPERSRLVRALAVAGFSAMNIMLLSVSTWSGADAETRQAFHWISAALALPAVFYSGQIFYRSAWSALRHARTNMDVPISIGVCLAFGLSLYETVHNGAHAYFDAATSLLFFLLVGRTLDHLMREKARAAVRGLERLSPRGATVLHADGCDYLRVEEIEPGMRILLRAGDRIPVDGRVEQGESDLDAALATGESGLKRVRPGSSLRSGTLNLSAPLTMVATARAADSFLAEMVRLMEAAEGGRARYRRLADRAARLYAPVVHMAAFLTFLGWMLQTGDWHRAINIAIAVLIITCPCALGLAVPIVQVVAARRLFEEGILVKDGAGLERLAEIDSAVFDKTGTLTIGRPSLVDPGCYPADVLSVAGAMASRSNHPFSRALAAVADGRQVPVTDAVEHPGLGIEACVNGSRYRLGRAAWICKGMESSATLLGREGHVVAEFAFEDALRPDAREAVSDLNRSGIALSILSGDRHSSVAGIAARVGIEDYAGDLMPAEKVSRLERLAASGRTVLMVGDGLNDAAALAAAHVSMAPASAADVGRSAADFVFLRESLAAVSTVHAVARQAARLIRQNFVLAIAYNIVALPLAIAGGITPLIAALAMSTSSLIVVANALRLGARRKGRADRKRQALTPLVPGVRST